MGLILNQDAVHQPEPGHGLPQPQREGVLREQRRRGRNLFRGEYDIS